MSTPTSNTGSSGGGDSAGRSRKEVAKDSILATAAPSVSAPSAVKLSPLQQTHQFQQAFDRAQGHQNLGDPVNSCARLFTAAVVGLSGSEKDKGDLGVGKSCLCNRFIRPLEDDYRTDHISTLSPVDFSGRVVNNDHWLYWGDRTLIADDRSELSFRVIELTEFLDDVSFQPLKGGAGQRDLYPRRCATLRLQSADKLMYICKDQLGLESEYEQKPLPEGKATIDGFLCVFDVGLCQPNRPPDRQSEFLVQVLQNLLKLKKPVVLLTTKNDDLDEKRAKDAEKLLSRREFKSAIPIVETSAHKNVNVEAAFLLLAHLIDKTRQKPKIASFSDALKNRREITDVAAAAYKQKLRSLVHDYRVNWAQFSRRLATDPDFQHFCELSGRGEAQLLFHQHQKELKERHAQRKLRRQIEKLPQILLHLLPDYNLVQGKSWDDVRKVLPSLPSFSHLFQPYASPNLSDQRYNSNVSMNISYDSNGTDHGRHPNLADNNRATLFDEGPHFLEQEQQRVAAEDVRWSIDILYTREAEECFKSHVIKLETDFKRKKLQEDFRRVLMECGQVTPGKPLSDVKIFFIGKECFESLSESDLLMVYDQYQKQIIKTATRDFLELLQEQVEEFVCRLLFRSGDAFSSPSAALGPKRLPNFDRGATSLDMEMAKARRALIDCRLTEADWRQLCDRLQEDARYRRLNRLHQSRDSMVARFASFLQYPLRRHCPAENRCADLLIENALEKYAHQWKCVNNDRSCLQTQTFPGTDESEIICFNLFLLDFDGIASQFICETRLQLKNNDFLYNNQNYRFEYRCVDCANGDSVINNSNCGGDNFENLSQLLYGQQFNRLNGLICLFSSRSSLDAIRKAFSGRLAALLDSRTSEFKSVPLVLLLACDPTHLDDLPFLQQRGASLAQEFSAAFVGLEPSNSRNTAERRARSSGGFFTEDQIYRAFEFFCEWATPGPQILPSPLPPVVPDFRLLLCFMCGDDFSPEAILRPFLLKRIHGIHPSSKPPPDNFLFSCEENLHNLDARNSFIFETSFLANSSPSRRLACQMTILAYHTGFAFLSSLENDSEKAPLPYHGCILVYDSSRKASFANLNCFAHLVPDMIPLLIVCVGEVSEVFNNPTTSSLINEGNDLADRIGARFLTLSKIMESQMTLFAPFFDEVYSKKTEIDAYLKASFDENDEEDLENDMARIRLGDAGTVPGRQRPSSGCFNDENATISSDDPSHYAQLSQFYSGPDEQLANRNYHSMSRSMISVAHQAPSDRPAKIDNRRELRSFGDSSAADGPLLRSATTSVYEYDDQRKPAPADVAGPHPSLSYRRDSGYLSVRRNQTEDRSPNSWWDEGDDSVLLGASGKSYSAYSPPVDSSTLREAVPSLTKKLTSFYNSKEQLNYNNKNSAQSRHNSNFFGSTGGELSNGSSATGGSFTRQQPLSIDSPFFAPLATPESLELGAEYMTVKDALSRKPVGIDPIEEEAQYATVASILPPAGHSGDLKQHDSKFSVEFDCSERTAAIPPEETRSSTSPYERTGRRPTPHRKNKKKLATGPGACPNIAERVRRLNAEAAAESSAPFSSSAYSHSSVGLRNSASDDNFYESYFLNSQFQNDEKEGDGVWRSKRPERKTRDSQETPGSPGLIRRLGSSFRFRCGLTTATPSEKSGTPPPFGFGGTKSVPQSPIVRERSFIVPSLSGASFYREHPPEASTSLIWLNPSTSKGDGAPSVSPKRVLSEKPPFKERKISRDMVKKISSELPLKYPSLGGLAAALPQKKRSTREPPPSTLVQLVPTEAKLKDLRFSNDDPIPLFLRKCVEFIEEEGLTMEGLYRVPGNQAQVITLEQKFIEDPTISFRALDIPVNAVTTALKNFFSYLSEPLIPYSMYGDLMDAMNLSSLEQKLAKINSILKQLSHENRAVLFYFISHLRKVAQHAHTTAMDFRNLAKCWWPTLLRPKFDNFETMAQMTQKLEEFVQLFLENFELLLPT